MNETEQHDPIELLHMALDAIDCSSSVQAIEHLKRLLVIKPDSAEAHYLLGEQQAKIGMPGRAVASMRTALAFQPDHDAARLRLGMLMMFSGQVDEARSVWQALNSMRPNDPFQLFKTGLLHLCAGDTAQCIACLERGMSVSHLNAALNEDIADILKRVRAQQRIAPRLPAHA